MGQIPANCNGTFPALNSLNNSNSILYLTDVWKSSGLWNMTGVGKTVFLNNTSGNNFKKNNKISELSKHNYIYTNLWIIKVVENEDYFKLIHLESKKFLTASPNGLTLDRGMYNSALKFQA